ncbi:hypothetical protein [Arthrobacter monumenti]
MMGHQDSADSSVAPQPRTYVSTVEADSTAKVIMCGAGILILSSLLLGLFLPPETSSTGLAVIWIPLLVVAAAMIIFLGPRWARTTAKVGGEGVFLSSAGIRARLPLNEIDSVKNSYFPSGGYGYRYLGKGHRGFISGGAQVDIELKNGRKYTVSVQSVDSFCSAVSAAKTPR